MLTVDATFIAHARTDVEALLDELAAARKENERLREAAEALVGLLNTYDPKRGVMETEMIRARAAVACLHSATEDADDRTT